MRNLSIVFSLIPESSSLGMKISIK